MAGAFFMPAQGGVSLLYDFKTLAIENLQHLRQFMTALQDLSGGVVDAVGALAAGEGGALLNRPCGCFGAALMHAERCVVAMCADRIVATDALCDESAIDTEDGGEFVSLEPHLIGGRIVLIGCPPTDGW